ncbi:hypothetical protein PQX77_013226 [Marasmius sp. AFHP31]|nr:hypothetical protein PQX77_013226 [Marasmius sp. AFHP31]
MFPRALLVALVLAVYASAACTRSYTVKSGDGCDSIAVANRVSSYQIHRLNGGSNACLTLSVGQSICLTDSTYDCQPVHTVNSGDSCFGIANAAGISMDKFLSNNAQLDSNTTPIAPILAVITFKLFHTDLKPETNKTILGDCTETATVQPGDTCDKIAFRNLISTYTIQNINPAGTCSSLVAGGDVCVDHPSNRCVGVYLVSGNEGGCANVASSHGITFDRLRELNPNVDAQCGNIYPGESLCTAAF